MAVGVAVKKRKTGTFDGCEGAPRLRGPRKCQALADSPDTLAPLQGFP